MATFLATSSRRCPLPTTSMIPSSASFKLESLTPIHSLVDAPNKVPQYQRFYQKAYNQHTRIWQIHPRSPYLMVPYQIALWGTFGASMYMMGRKILGYNTWFGKE
ncbi:hypothetical protein F5Y16DRAFT_400008 [Xylariaceae sp. FL0255]|nr:hypothetical protein F5Y16DRAFT_400008 [Xylariaceae sp. FL0255]